ncbi:MAG: competence/damage-inducible protein A [Acidobacteria bacterium]|nr:MAG: competence/damage-inducible protein A [Acidobacteriota bacterium]
MNAEIIAIGSELLTPFRQDTNSLYLTEKLNQLGVEVVLKTVVGDSRERLVSVAQHALFRSDIVIFMGGLGPTEDDLTREAVAEALGVELHRDPEILKKLEQRFAARGYQMTPNNAQQADVIAGATVLPNPNGSAPGQWITGHYEGRDRLIILLPGPPFELKAMFDEQCSERLRAKLPPACIATRVLKVAMMGESLVDSRVAPIYKRYTDVQTTILAGAGDVQFNLFTRAASMEEAQQRVDELAGEIEDELEDAVYSSKGESLEQIAGYYLGMRGATLAVAESCTGGLLAERVTSISGSSRYFLGGVVVYSNALKTKFADVPAGLITEHGAVSREVAAALAEGIRKRCKATFGIGITGVAGPAGGTEEKPVGLVYIALASEDRTQVEERKFPGDRKRVRWFATQLALDMIRRKLM